MDCQWVERHIDAYVLDALDAADRDRLEAHLARCSACRERLREVQATDAALEAAYGWADPGDGFAGSVAAARRRLNVRRWILGASAAAVLCIVVLYALLRGARPPEGPLTKAAATVDRTLPGRLFDGYGRPARSLEAGRLYEAVGPSAAMVGDRAFLLLDDGAEFAPKPQDSLSASLFAGTVLGQVERGQDAAVIELAPELGGALVRTRGCRFYSDSPGRTRFRERGATPGMGVHVFTGKLELDLGGQRLVLRQGDSALISASASFGTTRSLEAQARRLRRSLGPRVLTKRRRYGILQRYYGRRLLELRAAADRNGLPHLEERLALVTRLLHAHARTLRQLESSHPAFTELDAVEEALARLDGLRERAEAALERFAMVTHTSG